MMGISMGMITISAASFLGDEYFRVKLLLGALRLRISVLGIRLVRIPATLVRP